MGGNPGKHARREHAHRGTRRAGVANGRMVSRRAVVASPAVIGAAALVRSPAGPALAAARQLPLVQPLASQVVHEGYGVCQHVNFQTKVYKHQAEVMERYGQMAIAQMRSLYSPRLSNFKLAIAGARKYGVKWNATVATMDTGRADIESKVAHMAANNPDVIGWVEGVNEPNSGGNWVGRCMDTQRWIHDAVRSHPELDHVTVLGPSMHDLRLQSSGGAHWRQLADAGLASYMDVCAVHCYPAASTPDTKRAQRVQWVYDAFGDGYPIKFSEWGYTNTLGGSRGTRQGGARVIAADFSATYDCQAVLDFANHGWQVTRYEFLDDPDPGNRVTESNFGLWEVESIDGDPDRTWTPKPVVEPLTAMLRSLRDPGAPYATTPQQLEVDAPNDVRTCLTQKRDGSTRLWLWRHVPVWDPGTERSLDPGSVAARVERPGRTSDVQVGPAPVAIDL